MDRSSRPSSTPPAPTGQDGSAPISAEQLAALSHEFRTPLSGVLGMARLLEGTRLTAEQRAYVSALRESGQHLLTLVNDILDFAKLGADRIEPQLAPVDVEALLQGVCEILSPRARENGLEIAWAVPAGLGAIRADEARLKQILLNFAGNAVKFTPAGGVLLTVRPSDGGRLRFIVKDTGPGVSPADRERIFEAFTQTDVGEAVPGGAGLGLAIARRLAQAMGGQVGVDADIGQGACFWFEAAFPQDAAPAASTSLTGRTVGVASPNLVVRDAARAQIEACGGKAVVAETLDGLLTQTEPQDVLLLDHALRRPRQPLKPPAGRKAIVLLAPAERDRISRYRKAGFAGYLIKPLRRASLAERVHLVIGDVQTPGPAAEDERVAEAAAPGARVLLVEDNPINALLARVLLTREGCAIDHALGGEEAIAATQVGPYDVILMDMRMPGLSGEETTRELRRQGVDTPIIALTANAFEDERQACLAAGMNDFLVKPLSSDALRAALSRWVGRRWTETPARAKLG